MARGKLVALTELKTEWFCHMLSGVVHDPSVFFSYSTSRSIPDERDSDSTQYEHKLGSLQLNRPFSAFKGGYFVGFLFKFWRLIKLAG